MKNATELAHKTRHSSKSRVSIKDFGLSRTKQSMKDETDINKILEKYLKFGVLPASANSIQGHYGDFTGVEDYHSALNAVQHAEHMFLNLPSSIRRKFGNDPGALLAFLSDEKNRDEAITLGLIEKPSKSHYVEPTASPEVGQAEGASGQTNSPS